MYQAKHFMCIFSFNVQYYLKGIGIITSFLELRKIEGPRG